MTMTERAYTVSEIDKLKKAHKNEFIWGYYSGPFRSSDELSGFTVFSSGSYNDKDMLDAVECGVRLSMLAGHTAEDLLASEEQAKTPTPMTRENDTIDRYGICTVGEMYKEDCGEWVMYEDAAARIAELEAALKNVVESGSHGQSEECYRFAAKALKITE